MGQYYGVSWKYRLTLPDMISEEVVYIHPSKHAASFKDYAKAGSASPYMLIPVGVSGMMNMLREDGFRVRGINLPLEIFLDQQFVLESWLKSQHGVRLFAIDLHWYEHSFGALDVASACKQIYPEVPVVLGGLTASLFAKEILEHFPQIDFIILGDGEIALRSLARHLSRCEGENLAEVPNLMYRQNRQVVSTGVTYCAAQTDLDSLNFVDMDFMLHADQHAELIYSLSEKVEMADSVGGKGHWLTIGRGCLYNCSFCGGGNAAHMLIAKRKGIIPRSPKRVVDDLERLRTAGIQQVSLNLDPAIMGRDYWHELFAEMRLPQVKIGFYIEFFQLPEDEFIQELLLSADIPHSELAFSPLSGSERVRRMNGKIFPNSQLANILEQLRHSDMAVFIYFSLNLPGEDIKSFRQTLRLADEIGHRYPPQRLRMINMVHTIDPCSPMSRQPRKYNQRVQFQTFMDYYTYCQETPVLRKDRELGAWRGYYSLGQPSQALENMAAEWNRFCAHQRSRCYPVPRTW